jgi:hypothetical protein
MPHTLVFFDKNFFSFFFFSFFPVSQTDEQAKAVANSTRVLHFIWHHIKDMATYYRHSMVVLAALVFAVALSAVVAVDTTTAAHSLHSLSCADREPLPRTLDTAAWNATRQIHLHSIFRVDFTSDAGTDDLTRPSITFTILESSLFRLYMAPDDKLDVDITLTNVITGESIVRFLFLQLFLSFLFGPTEHFFGKFPVTTNCKMGPNERTHNVAQLLFNEN